MKAQASGMLLAVAISLAMWLAIAATAKSAFNFYEAEVAAWHPSMNAISLASDSARITSSHASLQPSKNQNSL
jgi:hypothetical protein